MRVSEGWLPIVEMLQKKIGSQSSKITLSKLNGRLVVKVDDTTVRLSRSTIERTGDKSEKTCEICGKPGRLVFADEYFVRCEKCLNSKYL